MYRVTSLFANRSPQRGAQSYNGDHGDYQLGKVGLGNCNLFCCAAEHGTNAVAAVPPMVSPEAIISAVEDAGHFINPSLNSLAVQIRTNRDKTIVSLFFSKRLNGNANATFLTGIASANGTFVPRDGRKPKYLESRSVPLAATLRLCQQDFKSFDFYDLDMSMHLDKELHEDDVRLYHRDRFNCHPPTYVVPRGTSKATRYVFGTVYKEKLERRRQAKWKAAQKPTSKN